MPEEFPSLALLVAAGVSDGGKPVITLQPGVPVLHSQLSHWMRSVNTSLSHPEPRHTETGSSTVEVAKETLQQGLGFLPRQCRDNPAH